MPVVTENHKDEAALAADAELKKIFNVSEENPEGKVPEPKVEESQKPVEVTEDDISDLLGGEGTKEEPNTPQEDAEYLEDILEIESLSGQSKKFKLNYKDKEGIKNLAKEYHQLKEDTQSIQALREEIQALKVGKSKEAEELKQLRGLLSQGPEAALNHMLKDEGGYDSYIKKQQAQWEAFQAMTPEQQEEYNRNKQLTEIQQANKDLHDRIASAEKQAQVKEEALAQERLNNTVHSIASKYTFDKFFGDNEALASSMSETMMARALKELGQKEDAGVTLTPPMIEQAIRDSHKFYAAGFKGHITKKATEAISNQKAKAAKGAAKLSGTKKAGMDEGEIINKLTAIFQKGQEGKLLSTEKGMALVAKYERQIRDRLTKI